MPTGVYDHSKRAVHGHRGKDFTSPEYYVYVAAKQRCTNPRNASYKNYGGRGIKFKFKDFQEFIKHIGLRPNSKVQLDRIKNDGNYEVGNVRWATKEEQMLNRRRPLKAKGYILYKGKKNFYRAQIMSKGVSLYLGSFCTKEEAHLAYEKAKKEGAKA